MIFFPRPNVFRLDLWGHHNNSTLESVGFPRCVRPQWPCGVTSFAQEHGTSQWRQVGCTLRWCTKPEGAHFKWQDTCKTYQANRYRCTVKEPFCKTNYNWKFTLYFLGDVVQLDPGMKLRELSSSIFEHVGAMGLEHSPEIPVTGKHEDLAGQTWSLVDDVSSGNLNLAALLLFCFLKLIVCWLPAEVSTRHIDHIGWDVLTTQVETFWKHPGCFVSFHLPWRSSQARKFVSFGPESLFLSSIRSGGSNFVVDPPNLPGDFSEESQKRLGIQDPQQISSKWFQTKSFGTWNFFGGHISMDTYFLTWF